MSWRKSILGDICTATQGQQIPKSEQKSAPQDGYRRYLYISDFRHDKNLKFVKDIYPNKLVRKDDLVVSNTGSQGEIFRGVEGILSNNLFRVSYDKKIVSGDFLYYFINSPLFQDYQSERTRGTTQPHMGHKNFLATPIFLPPLQVQKQIVEKLDEAFADIDKAIRATEKSKNNLVSLFQKVLDDHYRALDLICPIENIIDSKGTGIERKASLQDTDKPYAYLKMNNINAENQLSFSEFTAIDATDSEVDKYRLDSGDFLFNTRNSFELVGKSAVFRDSRLWLFNNNILRIKFKKDIVPEFINFFCSSTSGKSQLKGMKTGTTNVSAIYYKDLKKLLLPDLPRHRQSEIVEKIKSMSVQIGYAKAICEKKLIQFRSLKSSILNQAFSGELTKDVA